VIRGDIGVTAQTITPNLARSLKLARDSGVVLANVEQGGGADNAGLKIGDVILSVNGRRMESARQFHVWVYRQPVNAVAKVEYMRGQETATADVVVLEQHVKSMHFIRLDNPADHVFARLRILGIEVDDDVLKEMPPLRLNYGIVVLGLLPGISSGDPQLEVGDVIHQVEGQPVATLKDLRDNLGQHKANDTLVLQIEREGKLRFNEFTLD
jgi:serine protease Do